MYSTEDESAVDGSDEEDVEIIAPMPLSALASRRQSLAALQSRRESEISPAASTAVLPASAINGETATASTIAMFSALRDQITAQINALQQNLPSMQFSDLLQEQNFPALGRRFSSLVPMRRDTPARSDSPSSDPPPPYHEACPDGVDNDFDTKPPEVFIAESSRSTSLATIRAQSTMQSTSTVRQRLATSKITIGKTSPTDEEAAELRRIRQEKLTPAKYDKNLWSIWVSPQFHNKVIQTLMKLQFPLLIILITWYFSGLQAPPLMIWLRSFNETVTETFGKALPTLPNIPDRLRLAVAG
jgi:hypothetical protein